MECRTLVGKDFVLFVGEGDFSFAASYISQKKSHGRELVFATSLISGSLTSRQKKNIEVIMHNGGIVYTDVDATNLQSHPHIKNNLFSKIIFNFPHVAGKMNIRKNRSLVLHFFISAQKFLKKHGTIWVTLCQGQGGTEFETSKREWCNTWQIVNLAASASLILCDISTFNAADFKTYECSGYRGLQKSFNTSGAITHIFSYKESVNYEMMQKWDVQSNIVKTFIRNCKILYENISKKLNKPVDKLLASLDGSTNEIFPAIHRVIISGLLSCENLNSSKLLTSVKTFSEMNCEKASFCKECLVSLFLHLLSIMTNESVITSATCSISCLKYFELCKLPFYHILLHFSDNKDSLIEVLHTHIGVLQQVYSQESNKYYLTKEHKKNSVDVRLIRQHNLNSFLEDVTISNVMNVYATCSVTQWNGYFFFHDVTILTQENLTKEQKYDKCFEIGNIFKFRYNSHDYFTSILNLDIISNVKFHIADDRIPLIEESYFTIKMFDKSPQIMYRAPSLFPPSYTHDTSFWVNENFLEVTLSLLIRNTVGYLVKNVLLIDSYYHEKFQRSSKCYRFIYQSYNEALSKEQTNKIHTKLMRRTLEKVLKVNMR